MSFVHLLSNKNMHKILEMTQTLAISDGNIYPELNIMEQTINTICGYRFCGHDFK